jgi:allantoate deiminase
VLAFSDEEGVRFHSTYLGSKSVAGLLDEAALSARDAAGIPVVSAIATEGFKEGVAPVSYQPGGILGYVELHIEQGRVLESEGLPVCAVSGISGQTRLSVKLTGRADHAGTTPMPLRRDALAGAAECILEAEHLAKQNPPLLVTVGRIEVHPGASNSVPQETVFTVDLRHPEDFARREFLEKLRGGFESVSTARGLILEWSVIQDGDSVPCDPELTRQLLDVLEARVQTAICLPSGAGHDAVIMSTLGPVAMIFVRCRDGLSHHPDEFATPEDIAIGIEVLVDFLKSFKP